MNASHVGATGTKLRTKSSGLSLSVKSGNTPTLTPVPVAKTTVGENSNVFKMRLSRRRAAVLNRTGVVRLPIYKRSGDRRMRFPGKIQNVAVTAGDTVVRPDEAKGFEIRVFSPGISPNDRQR